MEKKRVSAQFPAVLTVTVTPYMEKQLKETFNLEIEMLQAKKKKLPDGRTWYRIEITDEEKAQLVRLFMSRFFTRDMDKNKN